MISPPPRVISPITIVGVAFSLTKCTEPSPKRIFTPPVWNEKSSLSLVQLIMHGPVRAPLSSLAAPALPARFQPGEMVFSFTGVKRTPKLLADQAGPVTSVVESEPGAGVNRPDSLSSRRQDADE